MWLFCQILCNIQHQFSFFRVIFFQDMNRHLCSSFRGCQHMLIYSTISLADKLCTLSIRQYTGGQNDLHTSRFYDWLTAWTHHGIALSTFNSWSYPETQLGRAWSNFLQFDKFYLILISVLSHDPSQSYPHVLCTLSLKV